MNVAYRSPWLIGRAAYARVGQGSIGPVRCRTSCVVRTDPSILAPARVHQNRPLVVSGSTPVRVQNVLPSGWVSVLIQVDAQTALSGFIRAAELMTDTGSPIAVPSDRPTGGGSVQFPDVLDRFPTQADRPPPPTTARCEQPSCSVFTVDAIAVGDRAQATPIPFGTVVEVTSTTAPAGWVEVLVDLPAGRRLRRYMRASDLVPPPPPPETDPELTAGDEPETPTAPTGLERAAEIAVLLSPLWGAFLLSLAFPPRGAR